MYSKYADWRPNAPWQSDVFGKKLIASRQASTSLRIKSMSKCKKQDLTVKFHQLHTSGSMTPTKSHLKLFVNSWQFYLQT